MKVSRRTFGKGLFGFLFAPFALKQKKKSRIIADNSGADFSKWRCCEHSINFKVGDKVKHGNIVYECTSVSDFTDITG